MWLLLTSSLAYIAGTVFLATHIVFDGSVNWSLLCGSRKGNLLSNN